MKTLLAIIFLTTSLLAASQENYLVTIKGDTIYGEIDFIEETSFDEIVVKSELGKQTFKPYQIKSATRKGEVYFPIIFSDRQQMGKVIAKGDDLSLFHIRPSGEYEFATKIFIKGSGETLLIPNISFRKQTSRFLKDCNVLSTKISEGIHTSSDLEAIVEEYNGACLNPVDEKKSPIDQMREFNELLNEVFSFIDSGKPIPKYLKTSLSKYDEKSISEIIREALKEDK